jgi:hypothetical protein
MPDIDNDELVRQIATLLQTPGLAFEDLPDNATWADLAAAEAVVAEEGESTNG